MNWGGLAASTSLGDEAANFMSGLVRLVMPRGSGVATTARAMLLGFSLAACLGGCTSIGPSTVSRDRFDYTAAISDSWKVQMLLNLVKIRYGDAPVFMDVASVISQYQVQGALSLSGNWFNNPSAVFPAQALSIH